MYIKHEFYGMFKFYAKCICLWNLLFAYLVIFHAFLLSADIFQNQLFENLSRTPQEFQTVWIQIRPNLGFYFFSPCLIDSQSYEHPCEMLLDSIITLNIGPG